MLGSFARSSEHLQALEQVKTWTRERFGLQPEAPIMVSEVECGLPGCPPLETVVVFWDERTWHYSFKVFKPVAEVVEDDLPFTWLKDSLRVPPDFICECC